MSSEHEDDLTPSMRERRQAIQYDHIDLLEELEEFDVTELEIEGGRQDTDDDGVDVDELVGY